MELWDSNKTNRKAIEFSSGWDNKSRLPYDDLLVQYQIELDKVYSSELLRLGLITLEQHKAIQEGLEKISMKHRIGEISVVGYEDVHSMVESKLIEFYGSNLVGNVHLGLSRNDQIATLMRMWMKDQVIRTCHDLEQLLSIIEEEIVKNGKKTFVGYTHHRIAMPTTYGDLLKSYLGALTRDSKYLEHWLKDYDECPLGAAAGFGSPIGLDRNRIAKDLGFEKPMASSLDAVTTRWEPEVKLADVIKVMMTHISVIAQDFIINSMAGIDIISLPSEYCTGSSIMPQKLNPDVLETIKRKAIDIEGEAFKLSSVGRSNISGYNKDTQGSKYWIINIFQELSGTLEIISEVIKGTTVNDSRARELLEKNDAYSALETIKQSVERKESYRDVKLKREKELKNNI